MTRPRLELATIAFNKAALIGEQIRLLRKYLDEDFGYTVVDASSFDVCAAEVAAVCELAGVGYLRSPSSEHSVALQFAWDEVLWPSGAPYVGMLDHDVFPVERTRIVDRIDDAGFVGCGQRHAPTGRLYLWPGWCFFARSFIADRPVDWSGIRGEVKADDGDTGSNMWPLFDDDAWKTMWRGGHTYKAIRPVDDAGLQSWGVEYFGEGAWMHASNGSNWARVPNWEERERIIHEMLAAL